MIGLDRWFCPEPAETDRRTRAMVTGFTFLVSLAAGIVYKPLIIDDSYIGFRYALNIAAGHGMVFNAGEHVMGVSSPSYVYALGFMYWLGFPMRFSGLFLGIVPVAIMAGFFQLIALRVLSWRVALAAGLVVALFPTTLFTANSGMDTPMSVAAVYGTFYFTLARRPYASGAMAGLALLTRPDGALMAMLAVGYALIKDRRQAWKPLAMVLLLNVPWLAYATWFYGTPLPHSIEAKQANHPNGPLEILAKVLIVAGLAMPITLAALGGIGRMIKRRSELLVFAGWMGAYLAGLIMTGINPLLFLWYLTPLAPAWILFGAYGAEGLGQWLGGRWSGARPRAAGAARHAPLAILLAGAVLAASLSPAFRDFLYSIGYKRADNYYLIGKWLDGRIEPGSRVQVGECGALSYTLGDHVILDSSGLNSPEVFDICSTEGIGARDFADDGRPVFNTWHCELKLIRTWQPDYIVNHDLFMHLGELSRDPWFRANYRRLDLWDPELKDYFVLEKTGLRGR